MSRCSLFGLVLALAACGSSEDGAGSPSSTDAGSEAGVDAAADALADADTDAQTDAGGSPADGGGDATLPDAYQLTASAEGKSPDESELVQCSMTLFFENVVHDGNGGWHADMGGEVYRTIFAGTHKYEFQSLVGVDADLVVTASGVELILNDMVEPDEKPFWQELAKLTGSADGAHAWSGSWTCAPLLIDQPPGFVDMKTTVQGTWTSTTGP